MSWLHWSRDLWWKYAVQHNSYTWLRVLHVNYQVRSKLSVRKLYLFWLILSQNFIIGLCHCAKLDYGNNITIAASCIIVIITQAKWMLFKCYNCSNLTTESRLITARILLQAVVETYYCSNNWAEQTLKDKFQSKVQLFWLNLSTRKAIPMLGPLNQKNRSNYSHIHKI